MDDFNFDTSDANVSGDTSSESTLEPEPPVEMPEETLSDPEPSVETVSEPEQSVEIPEDVPPELQPTTDNLEETIVEPEASIDVPEETPADPTNPGDWHLTRPTYFEAKEGDRNVEDDMVEGNYDLHPKSIETRTPKPGDLDWIPTGPEQGG